ncbi:sialic acid-binding Ig-like lectin 10 [Podarcis lilfordi]|uniref:Sialic acid-binding Ig-like lectin 10 n=1 Tax=Podarcis lilfordi TaxID=74358 RepID=A0AA35KMZ4_9SAUR|nr:sialic acid-binding Ig-like lectin 10 [Podarcis lilfordi]
MPLECSSCPEFSSRVRTTGGKTEATRRCISRCKSKRTELQPQKEASGSKKMPRGRRTIQLMNLPWGMKSPVSLMPMVTLLILPFLCKGLQSQFPGYELKALEAVTVQRGLCVHIPCNFTYPTSQYSAELYVYWIKNDHAGSTWRRYTRNSVAGIIVASNDKDQSIASFAGNRFQLTGNPSEGDCSFSINDVKFEDEGQYYFRIEKGTIKFSYRFSFISPHVSVTELAKPKILNLSEVVLGKSVTLICQAPGTCPWKESWSQPKISWSNLPGTTTAQNHQHSNGSWTFASGFTFTPISQDQGRALTCRVRYPAVDTTVANTISLEVVYPPQDIRITRPGHPDFSAQKEKLVVREGDTVSLLCEAQGKPIPSVTWMKKNKTLNNHMQGSKETLQLSNIKSEDAGMYQCQAENLHGSIRKNISVIVQYRPRTMTFNVTHAHRRDPALARGCPREVASGSQLTVQEGNLLRLLCKADSNPAATTSWFKEGRALEKLPDDWLELVNVKAEDQGDYRCQAQNAIASAEGFLHLLVEYAPKLSKKPQKNTTCWRKDHDILCNCSLHSKPLPQIHWQVGGMTVAENTSTADLKVSSSVQKNEVTSSLIWTGSPDGDLSIICLGNNSLGVYTMQFLLGSLKTGAGSHSALLLSGLCGALLAAVVFLLCLGLIKFYKKRKATLKAAIPEAMDSANYVNSANGGQQRANNFSLIYSNILPQGQRSPHVGTPKAAGERTPKPRQIPRPPSPSAEEPDEVHYTTVAFKSKGPPPPVEESVEYSEIRRE